MFIEINFYLTLASFFITTWHLFQFFMIFSFQIWFWNFWQIQINAFEFNCDFFKATDRISFKHPAIQKQKKNRIYSHYIMHLRLWFSHHPSLCSANVNKFRNEKVAKNSSARSLNSETLRHVEWHTHAYTQTKRKMSEYKG